MNTRITPSQLAPNQTLKFDYKGKQRTVKVKHVVRECVKGQPYIHGFEIESQQFKNFNIDNCGEFSIIDLGE